MCWSAAASGSLEEQWRQECLAFARVRKLKHVADMRIFYVVRPALLTLLAHTPLTEGLNPDGLARGSQLRSHWRTSGGKPEGDWSSVVCLRGACIVFIENIIS